MASLKMICATIVLSLLGVAGQSGCDLAGASPVLEPDGDGPAATSPTLAQAISACGGLSRSELQRWLGEVSASLPDATPTEDGPSCAPETFSWSHDSTQRTLTLVHRRTLLNCAGASRSVIATIAADEITMEETYDGGDDGDMSASCECVFDFAVTLGDIEAMPVTLSLVQNIVDAYEHDTKLDGSYWLVSEQVDLAATATGTVVIEASVCR